MSRSGKFGFGLGVLGIAALHFCLSFFISFAAGLSPQGSSWSLASKVLMFPLLSIPALDRLPLPDWAGWVMWGALSLGWGFALCWAMRRLTRRRK